MSVSLRNRVIAGSALLGLIGVVAVASAATENTPPPDFSSNFQGWVGLGGGGPGYEDVPGMERPIYSDPAHPFVPNGPTRQPTFRIADLTNPNLKPWVKDHMKADIDEILAGKKSAFTAQSSCVPAGVPFFMGYGGPDPIVFLQTPKEVWMVWTEDNQIRRVYMNVPHRKNLKPSWYGESVGHYEGDSLVIDTIGMNDKTVTDIYRTPHTTQLHVIERYTIADDRKSMMGTVTVEDPGTFTSKWSASQRFILHTTPISEAESVCAENNDANYFHEDEVPIPQTKVPDF